MKQHQQLHRRQVQYKLQIQHLLLLICHVVCTKNYSLLETETLPSAKFFAECQKSDTRQRIVLGKDLFAECPALGKDGHSAKDFFAERQTLGKISTLGIGCP